MRSLLLACSAAALLVANTAWAGEGTVDIIVPLGPLATAPHVVVAGRARRGEEIHYDAGPEFTGKAVRFTVQHRQGAALLEVSFRGPSSEVSSMWLPFAKGVRYELFVPDYWGPGYSRPTNGKVCAVVQGAAPATCGHLQIKVRHNVSIDVTRLCSGEPASSGGALHVSGVQFVPVLGGVYRFSAKSPNGSVRMTFEPRTIDRCEDVAVPQRGKK